MLLPQTEADFSRTVVDLAKTFHWKVYHTWGSLHSAFGYPDLTLVRGGRLIFAELKGSKGKLTEEQTLWLEALKGTGKCEVYVFYPSDWETIVEILK